MNTNTINNKQNKINSSQTLKGVWISCYELDFKDKTETGFIKNICRVFSDIKRKGFNAVFVHVRSHSDAYYKSNYFPFSAFIAKKQGYDPGYDPLKTMCYFAKIYSLQIHAWINPFRITINDDITKLSDKNPAIRYIKEKRREVRKLSNGYYYNPSYSAVRKLIENGVKEICENYDVEGIHFDDYFYPTTSKTFDDTEYKNYRNTTNSPLSLENWRRENINKLIKSVYTISHKYNKIFGISPHCSFYYNYDQQFADIEKWCKNEDYIDYIAPQIYFGFDCTEKTPDNQPLSFKECLKYWLNRTENKTIYIGLALYRCGEEGEWSKSSDIISRQIDYLSKNNTQGYIIFSYSYFSKNKKETENAVKIINNS